MNFYVVFRRLDRRGQMRLKNSLYSAFAVGKIQSYFSLVYFPTGLIPWTLGQFRL